MVSIGEGSKQSIRSQLSGMGSNMITIRPFSNSTVGGGARLGTSGLQTLRLEDIKSIQQQAKFIIDVSPSVSSNAQAIYGSQNWPTQMQGVAPSYLNIREWKLSSGMPFTDDDVTISAKVCLLGQTVVDNIFSPGENPIGKVIRFGKIPFTVIGVLEKKGENTFAHFL